MPHFLMEFFWLDNHAQIIVEGCHAIEHIDHSWDEKNMA